MKIKKVEKYEAGYSRENLLKRGSIAAAAVIICGGMTSCSKLGYSGDVEYRPNEYDGGEVCVSQPNVSSEVSPDEKEFTLDGDVVYVSSESES